MTESVAQLQRHETGSGGIANLGNIFQPVYQMLLALHTAGCHKGLRATAPLVLGNLQQAAAGLSDVALQPVLAAMLKSTVAVWSGSASGSKATVSLMHADSASSNAGQ